MVVVLVALGVVDDGLLLGGGLGVVEGDAKGTIAGLGLRREHGDLERVEGAPGVAVGYAGPVGDGIVVDGEIELAEAAVGVGDGSADDRRHVVLGDRFEAEHRAAAHERGVDREHGVLGGGADEREAASLDVVEQGVLLALGEAVDLVEEEDDGLAALGDAELGLLDDLADALHADGCGVLADERAPGLGGHDLGERGLAGAGRAVEQDGGEPAGTDHAPEKGDFCGVGVADDVTLAGEAVEAPGAHPGGERLDRGEAFFALWGPEIAHRGIVRPVRCGDPIGRDRRWAGIGALIRPMTNRGTRTGVPCGPDSSPDRP